MNKSILIAAIVCVLGAVGAYVLQFYYFLGFGISDKASDWVDFSDFIGGVLGPTLSFLSLILLLHSLRLQNEANVELREEVRLNQKTEKFRTFETHFFNLLEAQRVSFDNFSLELVENYKLQVFNRVEAVRKLEDFVDEARIVGFSDDDMEVELDDIDSKEKIYSALRVFCNITKVISEKLSDEKGFDKDERESQYQTLISFTEFAQLRLVLISMQFIDCPQAHRLRQNQEFIDVMTALGVTIDPY